jgi:hypothetical protein
VPMCPLGCRFIRVDEIWGGKATKLAVWLVAASTLIALTASGVRSASAQVSGTLAATTSTQHCTSIVPPATFNSALQPSAPPVFELAANHAGTWFFNSNRTGVVSLLRATDDTTPVPPGTFVSTNSSAGSSTVTYKFNYTISSGIISTTLVGGSFLQAHSSGPRAGQTATSCSRYAPHTSLPQSPFQPWFPPP